MQSVLHSTARGPAKAILFALAARAGHAGDCWPGHRTLARDAGISRTTLDKYLPALIESGAIELVSPGSKASSARYKLRVAQGVGLSVAQGVGQNRSSNMWRVFHPPRDRVQLMADYTRDLLGHKAANKENAHAG